MKTIRLRKLLLCVSVGLFFTESGYLMLISIAIILALGIEAFMFPNKFKAKTQ